MSEPAGSDPIWLTAIQLKMLHAESIRLFGGAQGVRDEGLLQSALARPRHLRAYEEGATLFDLAAAYGFGIAKNHAFVDGNKRAALLAVRAFLFRNGYHLQPEEVETVTVMEGLAGGTVDEVLLAEWLETNAEPR
ncbi:MAG: type II toxin-antitoxin system death-on-curing family toxin [Rhodothermales bacterium]